MKLELFERLLQTLFNLLPSQAEASSRVKIYESARRAFVQKHAPKAPFWVRWQQRKYASLGFAAVVCAVLFNVFPGDLGLLEAGRIVPEYGPVEIVRGDETILVQKEMGLRKGDIVRVGNKAEATIVFPQKGISIARDRTQLEVLGKNELFVQQGVVQHEVSKPGRVATEWGTVRPHPGASFEVQVSESGEAKIVVQKLNASIENQHDEAMVLSAGEELRLRSDSRLTAQRLPGDLNLSDAQIKAAQSKLTIARTKLMSAAENFLAGKMHLGRNQLDSAELSFRSLAHILEGSSRDLQLLHRKNLAFVSHDEVIALVERRAPGYEALQAQTRALASVIDLVQRNQSRFGFGFEPTKNTRFNRYAVLEKMESLATSALERQGIATLQQEYVLAFSRDIINTSDKPEQLRQLQAELHALPQNAVGRAFARELQAALPDDLSL